MHVSFKVLSFILAVVLLLGVIGIGATLAGNPASPLASYQDPFLDKAAWVLEIGQRRLGDAFNQARRVLFEEREGRVRKKRGARLGQAPTMTIDWQLQWELEEFLRGQPGLYGVAVRNLDTGQTALINSNLVFLSASTYKVLVMYTVYQQMEEGTLDADELLTITESDIVEDGPDGELNLGQTMTVAEALEAMVTMSNNSAAYALTRLVGGWGSIDAAAHELGMSQTGISGGFFRTAPADMLSFFEALAEGQLVSAGASSNMVELLERQQLNDRIPALLPPDAAVAHKTGELPGVRNDVGIVYGPRSAFVICVFSQWVNEDDASGVIAQVSLRVYKRYG